MNGETWTSLGSLLASLMFIWAMFNQHFNFVPFFARFAHKLFSFFNPYIQITFHEYSRDSFDRGTAYVAIHRYLSVNSMATAKRLKAAESVRESETLVLSMDDFEEMVDEYQGIKVWWTSRMTMAKGQSISLYPREDEKRFYSLTFHKKYRDLIIKSYLNHVLAEGKAIAVRNRRRKLFTNSKQAESHSGSVWSHVIFEHPATFETLALEPEMKKDIMNDLITFSKAKDYYAKVGKSWKRGYLLYGPPGTGKSTMVAAMANLLQYDVYDLELTSVSNNTELRKLLINTSGKSIIVIEDIDCSLNLTGQRKIEKNIVESEDEKVEFIRAVQNGRTGSTDGTKVTLSGLLNFIDGLWSACGGERIFVFTTNYLEKLDPALVRRGRMDKHIKMSFCSFEVFKVLSRNYLGIESHVLFGKIEKLLKEANTTPADVVENLMPKSSRDDGVHCLKCLISALEDAKVAAIAKAEKEEKLRVGKTGNMKENGGGENNVEEKTG
ncbi:AAA-ATPase ASD, mitochondrial [Heracleum sosnowskyi]|uniref:AAA-ATPase ASD, mitochondrial n=1 Tax=Heracleum sosnowskyi TaxID=360622 RepID=A0AAD8NCR4_9APIA|nr:AAA-ATPase ASD, mitochondrial [Heracleum sosnowskyi]